MPKRVPGSSPRVTFTATASASCSNNPGGLRLRHLARLRTRSTFRKCLPSPTPRRVAFTYTQVTDLIAGVAAKASIAGFSMIEFMPKRDLTGTAAFTAARIAANVIGRLRKRA